MKKGMNDFLDAITSEPVEIEQTNTLAENLNYKRDYPKALNWLKTLIKHETGRFDIEEVLKILNINTVFEDMGQDNSISGYLEKFPNYWRIAVNKYENSGRQRFTLAHELAHLLFHRNLVERMIESSKDKRFTEAIKLFRSKDDYRFEEMEANAFAAELLMPSDEFRNIWSTHSSIIRVSQHFDVSLYAVEYRAKKLKLTAKEL